MNSIKRKLNSRDGVSILIALVGFLVAAMISAVIVTAAVTSAQRVADDKAENQAHLTLESAAQIVRDGIENTEYTFSDDADIGGGSASGTFAYEMAPAVEFVSTYAAEEYSSTGHSVSFTVSLDSGALDAVKGTFVMKNSDERYDLVITLCIDGSDEEIYLTADGACTSQKAADDLYHITWKVVSINGSGE